MVLENKANSFRRSEMEIRCAVCAMMFLDPTRIAVPYNKTRNRYQMRCSRAPGNQKMRDAYNAWRKQAQIALSKYQLGEIGWEEFKEIAQGKL